MRGKSRSTGATDFKSVLTECLFKIKKKKNTPFILSASAHNKSFRNVLLAEVPYFVGRDFFFLACINRNVYLLFFSPLNEFPRNKKNTLKATPGYSVPYVIGTLVLLSSFFGEMTGKQQALVSDHFLRLPLY